MFVEAIMMVFEATQSRAAVQMLALRPITEAMGPAKQELTKAPRVIKDEMSCCRSVEMFQPVNVSGARYPKIW